MSRTLTAPVIQVFLTHKVWAPQPGRRQKTICGFVRREQRHFFPETASEALDDEALDEIAWQYMQRIWPNGLFGSVVVSNITAHPEKGELFRLRPPREGAATAGYLSSRSTIPALLCRLDAGHLVALAFEEGRFPDAGAEDLSLAGEIRIHLPGESARPVSLPDEVVEALSALPRIHEKLDRALAPWRELLEWEHAQVTRGQRGIRYTGWERRDGSRALSFTVEGSDLTAFLKAVSEVDLEAVDVASSTETWAWSPDPQKLAELRAVLVGRMVHHQAETSPGPDGRLRGVIKVVFDDARLPVSAQGVALPPQQGFLVTSALLQRIPLMRQANAIRRLTRGEAANPNLSLFLFDASRAQVPDMPPMLPTDVALSLPRPLSPDAEQALAKLWSAEDLAVLSGPPGTTKSTLIGILCAMAAAKGLRVLVAPQAGVAVDNLLQRLVPDPRVLPLRVMAPGREAEAQSPFAGIRSMIFWLGNVRTACDQRLKKGRDLVRQRQAVVAAWHTVELRSDAWRACNEAKASAAKAMEEARSHLSVTRSAAEAAQNEAAAVEHARSLLGVAQHQLAGDDTNAPLLEEAPWIRC